MLRDDGGPRADDWVHVGEDAPMEIDGRPIVSMRRLNEARGYNGPLGVRMENDDDPGALAPWFGRIDLIAVAFPSFADGRGFSIARRIRRMGFRGELRATGPVIADQYAGLRACGFDAVETDETVARRQPDDQWRAAAASISLGYQRGYPVGLNILEARRAARRT